MTSTARSIARSLVEARRHAAPLAAFPGEQPADLAAGYAVQDEAIEMWRDAIAGWKIGRIPPDRVAALHEERLAGPIFKHLVWRAGADQDVPFPIYEGGFAAVEAEYVFRMGEDAPADKMKWTPEEALELVAALHVGVECAGSPLATINALGPTVVVADFGNNHGLILGPEISEWRSKRNEDLHVETFVDDRLVGSGGAANVLGGPVSSLTFLLEHLAKRGRPLRAGQLVSTGAVTGIHDIAVGQHSRVSFNGSGDIRCSAVKAAPLKGGFE